MSGRKAVIAHVSDPHLTPVPRPPVASGLKPLLGYLNWARKPGAHDAEALNRTIAAVAAASPDLVALTGDLIELGEPAEIEAAAYLAARFGPPARVAIAPGNHDCYTPAAVDRLRAGLSDWFGPGAPGDLRGAFPRLDAAGPASLITLCSGLPTWLFSAEGELGVGQLKRLDALLSGLDRRKTLPVIAVHHAPEEPSFLKRLRDAPALIEQLLRHKCPLLLHGHLHESRHGEIARDGATLTLIGAASASATGRHGRETAAFNLLTVERESDGIVWRIARREV